MSAIQVKSKIVPIMAEAVGIYTLPSKTHQSFQEQCQRVLHRASTEDIRISPIQGKRLVHVCNDKDKNIFKQYEELLPIKNVILTAAKSFIKGIGYTCDEFVITDAWLNIGDAGAILSHHIHQNSYLSGTYFVRVDPENHSKLHFVNDRLREYTYRAPSISVPINESVVTPFNATEFEFGNEGEIVFWKSHLLHGFTNPNLEGGRVTLSFNLMPRECTDGTVYSFTVKD